MKFVHLFVIPILDLLELENVSDVISNRINEFSKILNFDSQRIKDWCFVQSVLCWIWTIEDSGDTTNVIKLTKIFEQI